MRSGLFDEIHIQPAAGDDGAALGAALYRTSLHEAVTNQILDDLVKALAPRYLRLTAVFTVRGGIYTHVTAEHRKKSWKGQLPPPAWHVDPTGAGQTPM